MNANPAPRSGTHLADGDVSTLIGHAVLLSGRGEQDMPSYFLDLAARIASDLGDASAASRVVEIRSELGLPATNC